MMTQSTQHNTRTWLGSLLGLLLLFGMSTEVMGQSAPVNETFSNVGDYGGYQLETWVGDQGGTWTATDARTDRTINGEAIMVRNGELTSPSFSGGIGSLTVTTQRQFGGGSGDMTVTVNGTEVGTVPYSGDVQTTTLSDINVAGDIVVVIDATNSSSDRVVIDDLQWTGYTANEPFFNTNPLALADFTYDEGEGPSAAQSFTLSGSNLDGSDVTVTAPTNFEVSETESSGYGSSVTLSAFDGTETTLYVRMEAGLDGGDYSGDLTINGGGASATVSLEGSVIPPFDLPYSNAFRSQENYDDAVGQGFTITATDQRSSAGGYLKIESGEFVETPDIPTTGVDYIAIDIQYSITTFGGDSGQEFSLLVSTDGGDTYSEALTTTAVTDSYQTVKTRLVTEGYGSSETLRLKMEQTGGGASTRFRDLEIEGVIGGLEFPQFTEDPFWLMLALPVNSVPFSELAGQNLIQGIPGTNAFYDDGGNYEDATPNIFTYENTASDNPADGWTAPSSLDNQISSGQGFIWYFFNNDEYNSVPLPFLLTVAGEVTTGDVTADQNADVNFTLLGNPYNQQLPEGNISGNIQGNVQFWNPTSNGGDGGYQTLNIVPPFTGFFVENNGDGGEVTISDPAASRPTSQGQVSRIALNLQGVSEDGQTVADHATQMRFTQGATDGWDVHDLSKLRGFNHSFAAASFVGEKNGAPNLQIIDSREHDLQQMIEAPVHVTAENFSGDFELSASLENIPDHWEVRLLDTETGEVVDARDGLLSFSHSAESDAKAGKSLMPEGAGDALAKTITKNDEAIEARFVLQVDPQPLSAPIGGELPQELALNQNYPNPFNPATQISYELPESADVRLDVFNVQGQRVATLVNASQNAGRYNVNFDAGNLASGVYLYRLQAGTTVLTRKMTLVK